MINKFFFMLNNRVHDFFNNKLLYIIKRRKFVTKENSTSTKNFFLDILLNITTFLNLGSKIYGML